MESKLQRKHTFAWSDIHLTPDHMNPLRYEQDEICDKALDQIQAIAKSQRSNNQVQGKVDLFGILCDHHKDHQDLERFWAEVQAVPEWVDWEQIERGQEFFYRYAAANIMGLALQGFLVENSSASGVAEVLVRTGGFSTSKLWRRLLESFSYVLQITDNLQSIKPGGKGHTANVRVRLLHAAVRQRIIKIAETRPEYYDMDKFGPPINTLDMIHSVTILGCNNLWQQLPMMGIYPTEQEKRDSIALFRYVGHLLGAPDRYFASVAQAKATMESMMAYEAHITPTSHVIGHNFIECLKDMPPFNVSGDFLSASARVLNGDDLCDALGLGKPGYLAYVCFRGHCWLVQLLALAQRLSPRIDRAITNYFHDLLHYAIDAGLPSGAAQDLKYIPKLGRRTGKEANDRKPVPFLSRPVEVFYLVFFLLGLSVMVGMMVIASQISMRLGLVKHFSA